MKEIIRILTPSELKILMAMAIGSLILAVFEAFGIGILLPILDLFINEEKVYSATGLNWAYRFSGAESPKMFIVYIAGLACFVFVLKSVYSIGMVYFQHFAIAKIYQRLTSHVLKAYLDESYEFHLENNSSSLFKNISIEVGNFTNGYLQILVTSFGEILVLFAILSLLFYMYPFITCFLFLGLLLLFVTFYFTVRRRIKNYSISREKHSSLMFQAAQEPLNSIKEVKVFKASKIFLNRFDTSVTAYSNSFVKFSTISAFPRYIMETILFVSMLLVVIFNVMTGSDATAIIPTMLIFGVAAIRMLPSLFKIYSSINSFQFYSNSLDIVLSILNNVKSGGNNNKLSEKLSDIQTQELKLDSIFFKYKNSHKWIFQDLSLEIPFFKSVAFVGESGAGKSTLVDVIIGLLEPEKGIISFGGICIDTKNKKSFLDRIGYVPQEITLIDDTLEANIAFGLTGDEIDKNRVQEVIHMARLDAFVKELPKGVNTKVGERGARLSGGQRQRVGIARALYKRPEVLIFDEATSALDSKTEEEISETIDTLKGTLTIIIIAHRLSTIKNVDQIFVLDSGKIIDSGSFSDLIERSEHFRNMVNRQMIS
ncbi:MAG: ABC transporter ATP-binding protein [Desulfamplus sp.]|nr:ABC transporter ATP-binding protein [Desulfamplus sp.]